MHILICDDGLTTFSLIMLSRFDFIFVHVAYNISFFNENSLTEGLVLHYG